MEATLRGAYNGLWEVEKEKLHQRLRSFPPFNYPNILLAIQSMHHSSFLVSPLLS
jgi:muconolactone delta-isomerase